MIRKPLFRRGSLYHEYLICSWGRIGNPHVTNTGIIISVISRAPEGGLFPRHDEQITHTEEIVDDAEIRLALVVYELEESINYEGTEV